MIKAKIKEDGDFKALMKNEMLEDLKVALFHYLKMRLLDEIKKDEQG